MDRRKAEVGRVREEKGRRKKIREEKESEKRRAGARKGRKVAKHCVFPMFCGSGGFKSRLAKAAGAEPSGELWRDAHFEVKMHKTLQRRSTFGICDVEKVHTVVARSTSRSQNGKTPHVWTISGRSTAPHNTTTTTITRRTIRTTATTTTATATATSTTTTATTTTTAATTNTIANTTNTTIQQQLNNYNYNTTTLQLPQLLQLQQQ